MEALYDAVIWRAIERLVVVVGGILFGILGYKLLAKGSRFTSGTGLLAMACGAAILLTVLLTEESPSVADHPVISTVAPPEEKGGTLGWDSTRGDFGDLSGYKQPSDYSIELPLSDETHAAIEREYYNAMHPPPKSPPAIEGVRQRFLHFWATL